MTHIFRPQKTQNFPQNQPLMIFFPQKYLKYPTIDLHGASLRKWSCFFSRFATQNNSPKRGMKNWQNLHWQMQKNTTEKYIRETD